MGGRIGGLQTCFAAIVAAALLAQSCGDDRPAPIPDDIKMELAKQSQCSTAQSLPTPIALESPTPVPYPTPAGKSVRPKFDVPVFPNAVEIDGFLRDDYRVQVFETSASAAEVFDFFEAAFLDEGMVVKGSGHGVAGISCTFVPYYGRNQPDQNHWAKVTTEFVQREPSAVDPQPGFRGKGQPFELPPGGKLWFFVITPK